jgi:hypothetical protein
MSEEYIVASGNTEVPAQVALRDLGFDLIYQAEADAGGFWVALRPGLRLHAPSCLELLGLHCMRERRGPEWKASDADISQYLAAVGG